MITLVGKVLLYNDDVYTPGHSACSRLFHASTAFHEFISVMALSYQLCDIDYFLKP